MQEKVHGTDGSTAAVVKKMGVLSGRGFTVFTVILTVRSPSASAIIGIIMISSMRMDGNNIIVIISINQKLARLEKEKKSEFTTSECIHLECVAISDSAQMTVDVVGGVTSI